MEESAKQKAIAKAKAEENYDVEARRSHWDTDFIDWDAAAESVGVSFEDEAKKNPDEE